MQTYKDFTDDVSGIIVGTFYQQAFLTYEGRKQGPTMYVSDAVDAQEKARAYIAEQRQSFGEAFSMIYPADSWELKFV